MLITILIATAAIIVIFLAVAAMQPSNFPRRAEHLHRRSGGLRIRTSQRSPQMAGDVPVY